MTEISPLDPFPSIELAQIRERYAKTKSSSDEIFLMEAIQSQQMLPFYKQLCQRFSWDINETISSQLESENEKKYKLLQNALTDAKENSSEEDVRLCQQNLALFSLQIGHKSNATKFLKELYNHTIALGQKIDVVFCQMRLCFFHNDISNFGEYIDQARSLVQEGGDWERKNRLQIYEGLYLCLKRQFLQASQNFIQTLSTFTATELLSFDEFVFRVVILATLSLSRSEFRTKIERSMEIRSANEVVHRVLCLYHLDYKQFFDSLAEIQNRLSTDIWFGPHISFLIKELRVRAYRQFLQPFESVKIKTISETFGVTDDFIEKEMRRFIFCRKIDAKIDRVNGNIHTNPPDNRAAMMREALKRGEVLVTRLQKLGRILSS